MNPDLLRRFDSKPNPIPTQVQNRNFDVAVDEELLQSVTSND